MLTKVSFPLSVLSSTTLASGTRPDRGRPGSKPGLKAEVSPACGRALAMLNRG